MATRLPPDRHRHTCESCGQLDEARVQACPSCSVKAVADIWQRLTELKRKVERLEHPVGGVDFKESASHVNPPADNTVNLSPYVFGQSYSPLPPPASRG